MYHLFKGLGDLLLMYNVTLTLCLFIKYPRRLVNIYMVWPINSTILVNNKDNDTSVECVSPNGPTLSLGHHFLT